MYPPDMGSHVYIDAGHHNFHTKDERYFAFARLLERDGYQVSSYESTFTAWGLDSCDILVISNALHAVNVGNWVVPTPSAFTETEISILHDWVLDGGSLFLIADHMPMGGAAADLAAVFGFEFTNGFVFDTLRQGPAFFVLEDQSLVDSKITQGRMASESVGHIATFTGQGFRIPADATPVLVFDERYLNMLPNTAWVFDTTTTRNNANGLYQGAYKPHGKGKVVAFGEAAMFSAQLAGPQQMKVGMNSDTAPQNYQLLLNIIHWLDGKL
jgi:hypothetical protein